MKKIILGLLTVNLFLTASFVKAEEIGFDDITEEIYLEEATEEIQLEEITDLQAMSQKMQQDNLVLVLEFHAKHCTFCKQLEEEILIPMLYSGDYDDQVQIRQLALDSNKKITGFSGETTSGAALGEKMGIIVTPTLVFLNAEGKEISERIVGINTPELFGAYVDAAIEEGHQTLINSKTPQTVNQIINSEEIVAPE